VCATTRLESSSTTSWLWPKPPRRCEYRPSRPPRPATACGVRFSRNSSKSWERESIIDRSTVNAWDDPKVAAAIAATGRRKLIFAGISLEVCATFPAISAIGKGYDAYVAVDASGTFSPTKREAGLLRMQQAGVVPSDYSTLIVEILKDNANPLAGAVYAALDLPWAVLADQGQAPARPRFQGFLRRLLPISSGLRHSSKW
jgi:hypothetical protein